MKNCRLEFLGVKSSQEKNEQRFQNHLTPKFYLHIFDVGYGLETIYL